MAELLTLKEKHELFLSEIETNREMTARGFIIQFEKHSGDEDLLLRVFNKIELDVRKTLMIYCYNKRYLKIIRAQRTSRSKDLKRLSLSLGLLLEESKTIQEAFEVNDIFVVESVLSHLSGVDDEVCKQYLEHCVESWGGLESTVQKTRENYKISRILVDLLEPREIYPYLRDQKYNNIYYFLKRCVREGHTVFLREIFENDKRNGVVNTRLIETLFDAGLFFTQDQVWLQNRIAEELLSVIDSQVYDYCKKYFRMFYPMNDGKIFEICEEWKKYIEENYEDSQKIASKQVLLERVVAISSTQNDYTLLVPFI